MTTNWEWANRGVDLEADQLLWYEQLSAVAFASGAGNSQTFEDFLANGPSVEGVPADVVEAITRELKAMTFTVRLAVLADADGIGRVHAQAWREAYRGILSDEWIAAVSDDERIARWERILTEPNPATQWVAEADGRIVGFVGSGPARDDSPVRELELWSLYVLESHHRQGIATALADAAIGTHPASLWVVAQNTNAQAFYRRIGFEPDGAESIFEPWDVEELRMVR